MSSGSFLASAWDWKPSVLLGCGGLFLAYTWAARLRFSRRDLAWSGAILLVLVALVSPFDELADTYLFSAHMAKHILFVLIIPALLLKGTPERVVRILLRGRRAARLQRILNRPAITWFAGIGTMAFWHVPALFNFALVHEWLHIIEHLSLLVAGTIYWWPILSPIPELRLRPVPQAAGYLFVSCLACTAMGVLITFAPRLLYPAYAHPADGYGILPLIRDQWGISAAMDQQIGGLLMWVPGCLIYTTAIMAMFARWYGEESRGAVEA